MWFAVLYLVAFCCCCCLIFAVFRHSRFCPRVHILTLLHVFCFFVILCFCGCLPTPACFLPTSTSISTLMSDVIGIDADIGVPINADIDPISISDIRYWHRFRLSDNDIDIRYWHRHHHRYQRQHRHQHRHRFQLRHDIDIRHSTPISDMDTMSTRPLPSFSWRSPSTWTRSSSSSSKYGTRPERWNELWR